MHNKCISCPDLCSLVGQRTRQSAVGNINDELREAFPLQKCRHMQFLWQDCVFALKRQVFGHCLPFPMWCRAPGVVDAGPSVEILAEYHLSPEEQKAQDGRQSVAVAVRDKHLLATAFHPELTSDLRW